MRHQVYNIWLKKREREQKELKVKNSRPDHSLFMRNSFALVLLSSAVVALDTTLRCPYPLVSQGSLLLGSPQNN